MVLRRQVDGKMVLDQLARDRVEQLRSKMYKDEPVSASGEVCGIVWKWERCWYSWNDYVCLEGPLAMLDWDFILSGRKDCWV